MRQLIDINPIDALDMWNFFPTKEVDEHAFSEGWHVITDAGRVGEAGQALVWHADRFWLVTSDGFSGQDSWRLAQASWRACVLLMGTGVDQALRQRLARSMAAAKVIVAESMISAYEAALQQ
jgi:hypothetical protein